MADDIFEELATKFGDARAALPEIKGLLLFDAEGVSALADMDDSNDELALAYAASELLENIDFFLETAESTEWKSIIFESDDSYFIISHASESYFLLSRADTTVELQALVDKSSELAEEVAKSL